MDIQYHYASVTDAIDQLREKGYSVDFNLSENCIVCDMAQFGADEFDITEVYRYEGETDPADEATVYGITSTSGLKGVLVTGYGMSSDPMLAEILKKLQG